MVNLKTIQAVLPLGAALIVACSNSKTGIGANDPQAGQSTDGSVTAGTDGSHPPLLVPAAGGIWRGIDSDGNVLLVMVSPGASMTRIADLTAGYAGEIMQDARSYNSELELDGYGFWALPRAGEIESYGWSLCAIAADWNSRQPIQGMLACDQMPEEDWVREIDLAFDPLFDINADMSLLAGDWTDTANPGNDVASFDASGRLTGQNGTSDCVYLGNARVVDNKINLYQVEWSFDNCSSESTTLNGVKFTALATIDNRNNPMTLTVVGIGLTRVHPYEENGRGISFSAVYQKY